MIELLKLCGFIVYYVCLFALMFWRAFIGIKVWNLLILPMDSSLVLPFSVGQVACIFMMISYVKGFTLKDLETKQRSEEEQIKHMATVVVCGFLAPLVMWFFAWILNSLVH